MANDNFILTPEGRAKLEEELQYLETEKRAEIGERIKVAREFGDISENSEYDDAKNEQGMVEARIAEITHILSEATSRRVSPRSRTFCPKRRLSTRPSARTRSTSARPSRST